MKESKKTQRILRIRSDLMVNVFQGDPGVVCTGSI